MTKEYKTITEIPDTIFVEKTEPVGYMARRNQNWRRSKEDRCWILVTSWLFRYSGTGGLSKDSAVSFTERHQDAIVSAIVGRVLSGSGSPRRRP